ncbi:DUF397 domain-containing protein [Streptomyces reniochalinae]|uniref:DUF397 domain-containing protein n=1 Tax=Streptomyces reniochalinae TaxID=2250578 RepID=A0A367EG67_9ACTN|nr:DUF397 domain-containing protein [Streptomyces reniochalinae]RCG17041.1 DUF397 domain-containing protein [Streptomyces reniochalinae]
MSSELSWFKSSYSSGEGGQCLEVALSWRKSTHSDGGGGQCVEVATCPHVIHVRDSKAGATGPTLTVTPKAWSALLDGVR